MFSGGYRSFFSAAFPSIHHRNTAPPPPPLPPCVYFTYAIDIFLQGEQEQEPLYAEIQEQQINIKTYPSFVSGKSPPQLVAMLISHQV
jgi:hypothetical protein